MLDSPFEGRTVNTSVDVAEAPLPVVMARNVGHSLIELVEKPYGGAVKSFAGER
jgi:hypothetical protein